LLCNPDELKQVSINMMRNGLQAIENCRVLKVEVRAENHSLLVSGNCITREFCHEYLIRSLPQNPPTKVEKHSGKIEVTSVIGQRTCMVLIPIAV